MTSHRGFEDNTKKNNTNACKAVWQSDGQQTPTISSKSENEQAHKDFLHVHIYNFNNESYCLA